MSNNQGIEENHMMILLWIVIGMIIYFNVNFNTNKSKCFNGNVCKHMDPFCECKHSVGNGN